MRILLILAAVLCVLTVVFMAAGLAFGLALRAVLPAIELPFAVLIGTISFGLAIIALVGLGFTVGQFGRPASDETPGEDEEDNGEEAPDTHRDQRHTHRRGRSWSPDKWRFGV